MLDRHGLVCCARRTGRLRRLAGGDRRGRSRSTGTLGCDVRGGGFHRGRSTVWRPTSYRAVRGGHAASPMARLNEAGILGSATTTTRTNLCTRARPARDSLRGAGGRLSDLQLEIDVYWVAVAGLSPSELLTRAAGRHRGGPSSRIWRSSAWEGADLRAGWRGQSGLGRYRPRLAAREAPSGAIVEQDTCRRDPFDCLASSYRFLTGSSVTPLSR